MLEWNKMISESKRCISCYIENVQIRFSHQFQTKVVLMKAKLDAVSVFFSNVNVQLRPNVPVNWDWSDGTGA